MNGDLSLSQSLGGLRIANPTDDDVRSGESTPAPSAAASPPPSQHGPGVALRHDVNSSLPAIDASGALDVTSSVGFDPADYSFKRLPSPGVSPISTRPRSPEHLIIRRKISQRASQQASDPNRPINHSTRQPPSGTRSQAARFASAAMASQPPLQHDPYHQSARPDPEKNSSADIRRSQSRAAAAAAMQRPSSTRNPSERVPPMHSAPQSIPTARPYLPPRRSSRPSPPSQHDEYNLSRAPSQPATAISASGTPASTSGDMQERNTMGSSSAIAATTDSQGRPKERTNKKGPHDFEFGRTLGEGSYSTVVAGRDRENSKEYAIKVLDKRHIIKEKKVKYVNIEKDSLNRLPDHPGIVKLYYTFQNDTSLFYVLDLASGGELLGVLKKYTSFDEDCSRWYGAEILDCVEYMHSRGIIHRDLKPENVLLDDNMHVKITDFGTAKILDISSEKRTPASGSSAFGHVSVANDPMDGADIDRAVSFVGTAEYVSPELLTDKNACKASDLWAFGCIMYQLLAGRPPFKASNEYQTFQKIVKLDYTFPPGFPAAARDLIEKLLVLNPAERLPIPAIKRHRFFDGIPWGKGMWKQTPPKLRSFNPNRPAPSAASHSQRTDSAPPPTPPVVKPPRKSATLSSAPSGAGPLRPQPGIITELAPPSQLDIDWAPVLNRPNERILKLGNLTVYSIPAPYTPSSRNGSAADVSTNDTPSKFSRLFGASATKKRQRLVMVSSAARIILAPSGGDKKEAKMIIDLRDPAVTCRTHQDAKGYTVWNVWTRERHLTFEDAKANTGDSGSSVRSTQEWIDIIESAKDFAASQSSTTFYSAESGFNNMAQSNQSSVDSNGAVIGGESHRNMLRKGTPGGGGGDDDSLKGYKRFSKRHSKNGLAAVF